MITFYEATHNMGPGLPITARSTVVSTSQGVVVITPIDFSSDQLDKIRLQGQVRAVIAATANHSIDEVKCREWFPNAQFWSPGGLPSVRESSEKYHSLIADAWPFSPDLQRISIQGNQKMNEFLFYHPGAKCLICSDLVFNLKKFDAILSRIALGLMGLRREFSIPKAFWGKPDDLTAFEKSLRGILDLDFDQLVVAHGENVTEGAKELFRQEVTKRDWS